MSKSSVEKSVATTEPHHSLDNRPVDGLLKDLVARFDPQFRYTFVNMAVEQATGRSAQEFIGKTNQEMGMPAELVALWHRKLSDVFESGKPAELEFDFPSPDGPRHFVSRLTAEFSREGNVTSVVSVAQDVTEVTRIREKIQKLEMLLEQVRVRELQVSNTLGAVTAVEHFRAIVESSDDAIISKTLDGIVTSWNPGAQAVFGYSEPEMLGKPMLMLFPPDKSDEERFILEKIMEGEKVDHFETTRVRKDGQHINVSVTISPIRDVSGRIIGASKIARDITRRQQLEIASREFEAIVQSTDDAIIGKSLKGIITSWNRGAERMFGYAEAEMIGQPILRLLPSDREGEESIILEKIKSGSIVDHFETIRICKDGRAIDVSVTISPIRNMAGELVGASKIARDISAQKFAIRQLRLTASVFTNTSEGILITDRTGTIVEVNEAFSRITGYSRDEVTGQNPRMFRSSRQGPEVLQSIRKSLLKSGGWKGELWSRRKNGEAYSAWLTVSRVNGSSGRVRNYVALFSDVTVLKQQQEELEHGAHFDPLTDLPNRLLLSDRLNQSMTMCQRHHQSLAVLYLDLDGFKAINDQFGHEVGDELLIAVSKRMKLALRDVDTLARIGGDEFVAVLADVGSIQACTHLATRVLTACAEPVRIQGNDLKVTASIGITMYPQDNAEADQLMRHADQAMYEAKQSGKNKFHIFDSAQDAEVKNRSMQQDLIAQGLSRQEFVLHYQPKVNMRTGAVVGVEALIRWQHPDRGLLAPGAFLPAIEKHPLIEVLGSWVLETALKQMSTWKSQGLVLSVSVNIAARQLQQESFARHLSELLSNFPTVDAHCLELEILETSALNDIGSTSTIMQECHRLGVRFAIDDFGTGYSSLTYLRHLPVETLKIDQSFIRDMLSDQNDLSIVKGVIGLATAFQREVIAEGVETVAHGKKLLELGCHLAQGYEIARPMPENQILNWCATWAPPEEWTLTRESGENLARK
ncbi:PAS domain S-box protein [Rhodoferax sp.]|uniref:sensor domain-containing protein n=1 Tax=Rhodoferax sp. TaxID=50421 RepID=UPI001EB3621B|nr:PAS domain S-box protein [Rhodoferax sp.]MBT9507222.1 PAS domain S-box protein [Rhodoferax sp.]